MYRALTSSRVGWAIGLCLLVNFLLFYSRYNGSMPLFKPANAGRTIPIFDSKPYIQVVEPDDPEIWPYRVFKSAPWTPINLTITTNNGKLADGFIFFTPKSRGSTLVHQTLGLIMSSENELVYACNESFGMNDFRVQVIHDKPHATFWTGQSVKGHGYGELIILDEQYQRKVINPEIQVLSMLSGNVIPPGLFDFHEQEMTPWGTVLMSAYNNTPANLSAYGGPEVGWISDSLIYEVDIATDEIIFTWSALDHFALGDSRMPLPSYQGDGSFIKPFDFFHVNSMQAIDKDTILINSRHMWACYLISRKTGRVLWELNGSGEGGSFGPLPDKGQFRWQHQAHAHNITDKGMSISIFDNHNTEEDIGKVPTRGLVLGIELPPNSSIPPQVLRNLQPPGVTFTESQGSYDPSLENSNQLMGYGPIPVVREFGPEGDLLWEGWFGTDNKAQGYRTFKQQWHATPRDWDPSLVIEKAKGENLKGYVSWNGATDVESWNVYQVTNAATEVLVRKAMARGFETEFSIQGVAGDNENPDQDVCFIVAAIQGNQEVRKSNIACTP